jgi:ABC-type transporter Mla subunit MlaD
MKVMRRILGLFVMIAGILGLLLSVAGLVVVWVAKPTVTNYANTTISTLNDSITTSQNVMEITGKALGATVDSLDALSSMLSTTATTVDDTTPVLNQINTIMSDTLPSTLEATTTSLYTARDAAKVLESTIKSLDSFRFLISATPLLGNLVDQKGVSYNPEKPLADTLGELAANLEGLPQTFVNMSVNLSATADNLGSIRGNLATMSDSVGSISSSLGEYQNMIVQSQSSMDNLSSMLTNIQSNLTTILNGVAIVLTIFFLWLLSAQVVILSQGWELYQGTADRMESKAE